MKKLNLGVLYSGGKDSNYSLFLTFMKHNIKCLINIQSENNESYMFQSLGKDFINYQSEALNIPLIKYKTKGIKEEELKDLKEAIKIAIEKYNIEGIVTGAIKSSYQSSRIQKICDELNILCFNPLWQINEEKFLEELLKNNFEVYVLGIFSYPLSKDFLGVKLDNKILEKLKYLGKKYKINIAGEGGEFESFVTDSPLFKKKLVLEFGEKKMFSENSGEIEIKSIRIVEK